ncbi:hypothetical protein NMY22_g18558 [Coprinellus aureogranulatus]|nr:hypothetical protein NMY22_g18558 [Coprinellus aureogranulatus]
MELADWNTGTLGAVATQSRVCFVTSTSHSAPLLHLNMSAVVPPETFTEIFSHLRNDGAALKAVRESSMEFAVLSQHHAFTRLVFKDRQHIAEFFALASAPYATIPKPLQCSSICFKDTAVVDDESLGEISRLLATIHVKHSFGVHVTTGGIPSTVIQLSTLWKDNIKQLSLRGGRHVPSVFFLFLASFPRLEALALKNVHMEEGNGMAEQYTFPKTVTTLSLSRCAPLWSFMRVQVLPGGGLNHVRDLYIQELFFGGEEGVVDMRECFRELAGIHTLTLDPVYHATLNNFNFGVYDIYRRSWEATLLQMGGLNLLRISCANLPPKFAMEYVGMYALQFSARLIETMVEVYFPHSLELWTSSACEDFQEVSGAMRDPIPVTTVSGRGSLVVRGLPDKLPNGIEAARNVTVCGTPVVFKESNWAEVMGDRLDGI